MKKKLNNKTMMAYLPGLVNSASLQLFSPAKINSAPSKELQRKNGQNTGKTHFRLSDFVYLQRTKNGVLLKNEEILKAFSILTTALFTVYLVVFKVLFFIQPGVLSTLIVCAPFLLSIIVLIAVYKKINTGILFTLTWLMPLVMMLVSLFNPQVNYSKIILVYTFILLLVKESRSRQILGFVYLMLAYALIQFRFYNAQVTGARDNVILFEIVMMPLFALIIFLIIFRIKNEFSSYQTEIRNQKQVLERKNTSLENMVNFSEQQREKLKNTVLLKEKLISIISHDVRVPLNSFRMLINSYERGHISDKMMLDGIIETKEDLVKIDNMVVDLVNWSHCDRNDINEEPVSYSTLVEVMKSIMSLYALGAKNKNLEIEPVIDIPWNMGLSLSKRELELMIRNLLSNAIKFSNSGDKINVIIRANSDSTGSIASLSVVDKGVGMHPSVLKRLNGTRVSSNMGTLDEIGLGVGLSIVFDVINNRSLQYSITSEMGKGTEFSIGIPMVSTQKKVA